MANGILGRITGQAEGLRQFQEQQQLSPLRRQTAEVGLQEAELGLEQVQQGLAQSKRINRLLEFTQVSADQKETFLQGERAQIAAEGGDTAGIDSFIALAPEDRDQRATGAISIAQQQGILKPPGGVTPTASMQEFQFFQGLEPGEKETFLNIKRSQPGVTLAEVEGRKVAFDRVLRLKED